MFVDFLLKCCKAHLRQLKVSWDNFRLTAASIHIFMIFAPNICNFESCIHVLNCHNSIIILPYLFVAK